MWKFARKGLAIFGLAIAAIWTGAQFIFSVVSVPEDVTSVAEKLPRWLEWLLSTPSWSPMIALGLMLIFLVYAFWPDRTAEEDSRRALEKAWEFRNDYEAVKARTIVDIEALTAKADEALQRCETLETRIRQGLPMPEALGWEWGNRMGRAQEDATNAHNLAVNVEQETSRQFQEAWTELARLDQLINDVSARLPEPG